jgi:hypothetical protein
MPIQNLVEKVEELQNVLLARATGGKAENRDYTSLRAELLADVGVAETLPPFVRTCRNLDQFWNHIKRDRPRYEERRQYIWDAFAPAFSAAEFGTSVNVTSATGAPAIAEENATSPSADRPPRAFVSYSTIDKKTAADVKRVFEDFDFDVFVAHDDIQVSDEWRERILDELQQCDVFIPILSQNFLKSDWTQQEVGAVSLRRDVAVVPLSIDGTIPTGFIQHIQGKQIPVDGVSAELAIYPLAKKFPRLVLPAMIRKVAAAKTYRSAESALRPIEPHFDRLTGGELERLVAASLQNRQVTDASEFRSLHLPSLLKSRRNDIAPDALAKLERLRLPD